MSTAIDVGPQGPAPTTPHAEPSSGRGLASRGGQVATLLVVLFAIVTAFVGAGVLGGTPVQEAAGGWLSEDGTWVAPAAPAFRIWSVIYTGVLAYAVWQFLPSAQSRRHDRLRPWILTSLLLNAAWNWTVQLGALGVSVLVIVLLLATLCRILVLLETGRARGWAERILLDGVQGLHLGWVSIAVVANVAAWLGSLGWFGAPLLPTTWALIMIVVATVIAALTAVYDG
ncbi:tryptophan-rich sensory protein, partial [uncultured Micrococcus sp.]|uniref:tryptophan-rich sensory protein n=1 Tax=uncultured Micrococcus sp. TaxID=114051 RepID=UPI0025CD4B56